MAYLVEVPAKHRRQLAESMVHDPLRVTNFTDLFPATVESWEELMQSNSILPFVSTMGDEPAVFHWAHDMGSAHTGAYAWIGTYVLPTYRGRRWHELRRAAFDTLIAYLKTQNIEQIFGACRISNLMARKYVRKIGWNPIGIYQDWALFEGQLDACEILTLRPQDQGLAWVLAEERAIAFRSMHD